VCGGRQAVTLRHVFESTQPRSARAACVAQVSEAALHPFAPQTPETFAFGAGHPFAIVDHGPLERRRLVGPDAVVFLPRFGNVGSQAQVGGQFQRGVGVITFVGRDLFDFDFAAGCFQVDLRFDHAIHQRVLVGMIGRTNLGRQQDLAVQVDHVLGLVR